MAYRGVRLPSPRVKEHAARPDPHTYSIRTERSETGGEDGMGSTQQSDEKQNHAQRAPSDNRRRGQPETPGFVGCSSCGSHEHRSCDCPLRLEKMLEKVVKGILRISGEESLEKQFRQVLAREKQRAAAKKATRTATRQETRARPGQVLNVEVQQATWKNSAARQPHTAAPEEKLPRHQAQSPWKVPQPHDAQARKAKKRSDRRKRKRVQHAVKKREGVQQVNAAANAAAKSEQMQQQIQQQMQEMQQQMQQQIEIFEGVQQMQQQMQEEQQMQQRKEMQTDYETGRSFIEIFHRVDMLKRFGFGPKTYLEIREEEGD